jgi:hypothetical protein
MTASQSNLSVPCVGERERRIALAQADIDVALRHLAALNDGTLVPNLRITCAAGRLENASRILRGIPTQGET